MAAARSDRRKSGAASRAAVIAPPPERVWWRLLVIVAAGVLVYWNSLGNPFVFDDNVTLVDNPQIRSLANIFITDKGSALTGRPVVSLTFALNYAMDGLAVTGYRIVNIGLHVLCGLLLFGVVRRTLNLPTSPKPLPTSPKPPPASPKPEGRRRASPASGLAIATALLWVVHPLNSEVVDYLTQRTEALMALCYMLTLYASLRGLDGRRAGEWQVLAVIACATGMLCKETMVTSPLMVALFDRVFIFESISHALRTRWRLYAGLAATWIVLAVNVATASREASGGFATTHVSAWSYLLNQAAIVTHYLKLVVWPQALVAYYGWSLPATLADVWPYALFVSLLCAASAAALWRWPRVAYLPLWFFVTLAPTSSFFPIAAEVGADRRMYLPLMGLVALAVFGAAFMLDRWRATAPERRDRAPQAALAGAVLVCVAAVALGGRTIARNRDYSAELRLSQTTLDHWPSAVAHDMVGLSLAKLNRREDAMVELRQAVADYAPARYDLGVQLYSLGRYAEAVDELRRFVALEPHLFTTSAACTLIGGSLERLDRPSEAIEAYRQAVTGQHPDTQAHGMLADLLLDAQRYDEAITHYRAYLAENPSRTAALVNMGIALASTNKTDDAIATLRRAVAADSSNASARVNLIQVLLDARQFETATAEARQLVALAPASPVGYDLLGQALAGQKNLPEARRAFEQALQVDPGYAPARENLRRIVR